MTQIHSIKKDVKQARKVYKKKLDKSVDKLKDLDDVKKLLKEIIILIK